MREKLLSNKASFPCRLLFTYLVSPSAFILTAAVTDIWQDLTPSTWNFFMPAREQYLLADDRSRSYFSSSTSRAFAPSVVVNWYSIPKVPEIETLSLLLEFPSSLNSLSKHNYHLKAEETVARWDQVHTFTEAPRFISITYKGLCKLFSPLCGTVTRLKLQRFQYQLKFSDVDEF